jgi:hypothetical protein
MKTQTKYEEIFLSEIRGLPMPVLPQALKMLRSLKESILSVSRHPSSVESANSGFCGVWQDERSADKIIEDIAAHRSGFGGRKVEL